MNKNPYMGFWANVIVDAFTIIIFPLMSFVIIGEWLSHRVPKFIVNQKKCFYKDI